MVTNRWVLRIGLLVLAAGLFALSSCDSDDGGNGVAAPDLLDFKAEYPICEGDLNCEAFCRSAHSVAAIEKRETFLCNGVEFATALLIAGGDSVDESTTVPRLTITIESDSEVLVAGSDGYLSEWVALQAGVHDISVPARLGATVDYEVLAVATNGASELGLTRETLTFPDKGDGVVNIHVVDTGGQPVEGATVVVAGGPTGVTASDGLAVLTGIPVGSVRVEVMSADHLGSMISSRATLDTDLVQQVQLQALAGAPVLSLDPGIQLDVGTLSATLTGQAAEPVAVQFFDNVNRGDLAQPALGLFDLVPERPTSDAVSIQYELPTAVGDFYSAVAASLGIRVIPVSVGLFDPESGTRRFVEGDVIVDEQGGALLDFVAPGLLGDVVYIGTTRVVFDSPVESPPVPTRLVGEVSCPTKNERLSAERWLGSSARYQIGPGVELGPIVADIDSTDDYSSLVPLVMRVGPGQRGGLWEQRETRTRTGKIYINTNPLLPSAASIEARFIPPEVLDATGLFIYIGTVEITEHTIWASSTADAADRWALPAECEDEELPTGVVAGRSAVCSVAGSKMAEGLTAASEDGSVGEQDQSFIDCFGFPVVPLTVVPSEELCITGGAEDWGLNCYPCHGHFGEWLVGADGDFGIAYETVAALRGSSIDFSFPGAIGDCTGNNLPPPECSFVAWPEDDAEMGPSSIRFDCPDGGAIRDVRSIVTQAYCDPQGGCPWQECPDEKCVWDE